MALQADAGVGYVLKLSSELAARLRNLGLIARLTWGGALVSAVIAAANVWFIETRVTEAILVQSAARATDHVHLGILNQVSAVDFAGPHTPERLAELRRRLTPLLAHVTGDGSGIVDVNLVAADGVIIYAAVSQNAGRQVAASDQALLRDALGGQLADGTDSPTGPDDAGLHTLYEDALEVYVPVVVDGRVVGAYEVYQDLSFVRTLRPVVWGVLTAVIGVLAHVLARLSLAHGGRRDTAAETHAQPSVPAPTAHALTRRELEVLGLLAMGRSYRAIATELILSEETVRSHVKRILRKLGQPNRTAAVAVALRAGIIHLP